MVYSASQLSGTSVSNPKPFSITAIQESTSAIVYSKAIGHSSLQGMKPLSCGLGDTGEVIIGTEKPYMNMIFDVTTGIPNFAVFLRFNGALYTGNTILLSTSTALFDNSIYGAFASTLY